MRDARASLRPAAHAGQTIPLSRRAPSSLKFCPCPASKNTGSRRVWRLKSRGAFPGRAGPSLPARDGPAPAPPWERVRLTCGKQQLAPVAVRFPSSSRWRERAGTDGGNPAPYRGPAGSGLLQLSSLQQLSPFPQLSSLFPRPHLAFFFLCTFSFARWGHLSPPALSLLFSFALFPLPGNRTEFCLRDAQPNSTMHVGRVRKGRRNQR